MPPEDRPRILVVDDDEVCDLFKNAASVRDLLTMCGVAGGDGKPA